MITYNGRCVVKVQTRCMFSKDGGTWAIQTVDTESREEFGIHGDTSNKPDLSERKDVRNGVWIVPDKTKIFDSSHVGRYLVSSTIRLQV